MLRSILSKECFATFRFADYAAHDRRAYEGGSIGRNWEAKETEKVKSLVKQFILPLFAVKLLQPLYSLLHRLSLVGMNIGPVGEVTTSGELRLAKKLLRSAPRGSIVFDVGANVGDYAIACSRILPVEGHIFAFEPVSGTFERLSEEIRGSSNRSAITPIRMGMSDSMRSVRMFVNSRSAGESSIYNRSRAVVIDEEIELMTIDQFCAERKITHIFLLKIDIEGEEMACLKGCKQLIEENAIDYIQFEFGGCDINSRVFFKDFWEFLNQRYVLYRILQRSVWKIECYDELLEIFTTTNYLAMRRGLSSAEVH